jgi:hypothetical protein
LAVPIKRKVLPKLPSYEKLVRDAVRAYAQSNSGDMDAILARLRRAAEAQFKPMEDVGKDVHKYYGALYKRTTAKPAGPRNVPRYTRSNLSIAAQEEVHKKVISSIALIRLNREEAVAITQRRLAGWLSSIPPDGEVPKNEIPQIAKALKQLPYVERRVIIDQGHKLVSSIEDVVNRESGAIAGIWHSHVHQAGYDFRPTHAARDKKIYLLRGCWADIEGLVKPIYGYTDEMTMPAEEVNCRCYYQYVFSLKDLPPEMLTQKAKDMLAGAHAAA